MKRFLNKVKTYEIKLVTGKSYRYELNDPDILVQNELFIGEIGGAKKGLFVYKSGQIYSVSHDDFSYDFLNDENERLNNAYSAVEDDLENIFEATIPLMPDEDGDS